MAQKFNFKRLGEVLEADWPVEVSIPQDGGETIAEEFMARFRMIQQDEMGKIAASEDPYALIRAFFVGFGKGTEETFTEEVFVDLARTPYTRAALITANMKFQQGIAVKNSNRRPG